MKALCLPSCFFTLLLPAQGQDVTVYTPHEAATSPGNTEIMAYHWEYQQVFDASLFASLLPGGGAIRSIDLRASPESGFRDTQLTGIFIELSTTTRTADSLSPVFSENQGADKFDYWNGQRVDFPSVSTTEGLKIWNPTFSVPYASKTLFYDPSKGNLLMTIRNLYLPEGNVALAYDGVQGSPNTGSVRGEAQAVRGTVSSEALVVEYIFSDVVPEPKVTALLTFGAAALLGIRSQITGRMDTDVAC